MSDLFNNNQNIEDVLIRYQQGWKPETEDENGYDASFEELKNFGTESLAEYILDLAQVNYQEKNPRGVKLYPCSCRTKGRSRAG